MYQARFLTTLGDGLALAVGRRVGDDDGRDDGLRDGVGDAVAGSPGVGDSKAVADGCASVNVGGDEGFEPHAVTPTAAKATNAATAGLSRACARGRRTRAGRAGWRLPSTGGRGVTGEAYASRARRASHQWAGKATRSPVAASPASAK